MILWFNSCEMSRAYLIENITNSTICPTLSVKIRVDSCKCHCQNVFFLFKFSLQKMDFNNIIVVIIFLWWEIEVEKSVTFDVACTILPILAGLDAWRREK